MKTVAHIPPTTDTTEPSPKQQKLKKTCEDFEAIISSYLLKSMRESIPKDDGDGDGQAKDIYESMMDQSIAKELSHRPGLGLAKMLYKQLSPLIKDSEQGLKSAPTSTDKLTRGGVAPARKR